jgi:hypothetical protein
VEFVPLKLAANVDAQTDVESLNDTARAALHNAHLMPLIHKICLNFMNSANC